MDSNHAIGLHNGDITAHWQTQSLLAAKQFHNKASQGDNAGNRETYEPSHATTADSSGT